MFMKRKHIILIHSIFWGVILITTLLRIIPGIGMYSAGFIASDNIIFAASYVSMFYICYFYITREHLFEKRMAVLVIKGLVFIVLVSIPVTLIYIYFLYDIVFTLIPRKIVLNFGRFYFRVLETNFMYAMSGSLLKTALLWYDNVIKKKEADKQLLVGELALLRSQINPRFLSSTLTNIKTLINKQPDEAVYSIENLSEIMSYMLYETSSDKVPLDDEISYIRNYLNLQKVRHRSGQIVLNVTGDTAGVQVPPLIFMPFLENAFSTKYDTQSITINLDIQKEGDELLFSIKEHIKDISQKAKEDVFSSGDIRHFLDLQFGRNYSIDINFRENMYSVTLNMKLD